MMTGPGEEVSEESKKVKKKSIMWLKCDNSGHSITISVLQFITM